MSASTARVAVVTGGSQGLGLALARTLREAGYRLVIDARRADRLAGAAAELGGPPEVIAVAGDIADEAHRLELAAAAAKLGPINVLVNNASTLGASPQPELLDLDPETFRRIFDVNVVAPIALVRVLAGQLVGRATVLNITSDAGAEAYAGWGGYGASKAALDQASAVLALEAPELRVLVVDPGDMRTEMHAAAFPGEDISDRPEPAAVVPALIALIEGDRPSGRYVASELASEVTSR